MWIDDFSSYVEMLVEVRFSIICMAGNESWHLCDGMGTVVMDHLEHTIYKTVT